MKSLDWRPACLQSLIFLRGGRKNNGSLAQSPSRDDCEPDVGENKAENIGGKD